ncbi:hypothetical protein AG0111_0g10906 [Alternaria gaisen]|uniref:Uncharacterized protein n=1 Tax=Alternaria gaisen TaxID=167740 RepID=A0ACB6F8E9_9PLEO|nr:hypothetical protein AG0111_0g10906 [Alternaria gaisen]
MSLVTLSLASWTTLRVQTDWTPHEKEKAQVTAISGLNLTDLIYQQ